MVNVKDMCIAELEVFLGSVRPQFARTTIALISHQRDAIIE